HPMHATSRRRRRGAYVDPLRRRAIQPARWTKEQLPQVLGAPIDIASHQVCIVLFQTRGREDVSGEDRLPESGSESLDMTIYIVNERFGRAVRDVGIRPGRVPSRRRAPVVKQARLREDDE